MPEPRIHLKYGDYTLSHSKNRNRKPLVHSFQALMEPRNACSSAFAWKMEGILFKGGGRYRPALAALRADAHPQDAATWNHDGAEIQLGGGSLACFAAHWDNTRLWQIEYPSDSDDMSKFFLRTNEDNRAHGETRYLIIQPSGKLELVTSKPDTAWEWFTAGSAFTPMEVASIPIVPIFVSLATYLVWTNCDTGVLVVDAVEKVVQKVGNMPESSNNYIDANKFCVDKSKKPWSWLRPKLFTFA